MDEPFSSLDLGLKDDMLSIVQNMLAQQPLTLLYATHDPEEVSRLAKRLLLLVSGGQIHELSPEYDKTFKRMLRRRFREMISKIWGLRIDINLIICIQLFRNRKRP